MKNLIDCTNKLLRQYTRLGPRISFSSISSTSKLNAYKLLSSGGGLTLQAITKRKSYRNALPIPKLPSTKENEKPIV